MPPALTSALPLQRQGTRNSLSAWVRPLVQVHPSFGAANASLNAFFRGQQDAAAKRIRCTLKSVGPCRGRRRRCCASLRNLASP